MGAPEKRTEITFEMVDAGVDLIYSKYDEGELNAEESVIALFQIFSSGGAKPIDKGTKVPHKTAFFCIKCDHQLSYYEMICSSGACPYCGNSSKGLVTSQLLLTTET